MSTLQQDWDFFTNYGNYMPRVHCLATASGEPDWPWIGGLVVLTLGIIVGYLKIFVFWRKCYVMEKPADRNRKLWQLAMIFFVCAVTGYAMSLMMFVWPAYRLLAIVILVMNLITWKFALNLKPFSTVFATQRLRRELNSSLKQQNDILASANQAAEEASQTKSNFLANMSHEIRTPMTAILGYTDLLRDPAVTEKDRLEHIETISRNGEHLLAIVNDILDISKIEAGHMKVHPEPTHLRSLVNEVVKLMEIRATKKGLAFEAHCEYPLPGQVLTDATRVRQVLINLVGNAIKFTETGRVDLYVAMTQDDHPKLMFKVTDTGIGIPQSELDVLFQPFSQVDTTRTRQFGGTGLGLTISRRFAQMLGGDIVVQSEHGKGSTFMLTIDPGPLEAVSMREEPPRKTDDQTQSGHGADSLGGRVLLAEDGVDNQRLIGFVLRKAGLDVDIANNGCEALAMIEAADGGYDLLITDMQMPEMDGYELASALRERGFELPIVALTAHAMQSDREKCLDAGCNDYASKPIDRKQLIATCTRWLNDSSSAAA